MPRAAIRCRRRRALVVGTHRLLPYTILSDLREIAEVVAVRGNADGGGWAKVLSLIEYVGVDRTRICAACDVHTRDVDPVAAQVDVVVQGHFRKPDFERKDGVLHFDPGRTGPRRFSLPASMALPHIGPDGIVP